MTRPLLLAAALVAAVAFAGCGNPTVDSCQRFQDTLLALECVPDDYDVGFSCEDYADYPCDASPYFECLENEYTCDEGGNLQYNLSTCAGLSEC